MLQYLDIDFDLPEIRRRLVEKGFIKYEQGESITVITVDYDTLLARYGQKYSNGNCYPNELTGNEKCYPKGNRKRYSISSKM